jgi:hypothetical protein
MLLYAGRNFQWVGYLSQYSVWLWAGRPGERGSIPSRGERIFPIASLSRPALGPTQPPVQWVPVVLSPGVKSGLGVTLTTHPHVMPRSIMSRSYISSPPSSFVACSGTALAFLGTFNSRNTWSGTVLFGQTGSQQESPGVIYISCCTKNVLCLLSYVITLFLYLFPCAKTLTLCIATEIFLRWLIYLFWYSNILTTCCLEILWSCSSLVPMDLKRSTCRAKRGVK